LTDWVQEHVRDADRICINIHLKTSPAAYVPSFCSFGLDPYASGADWFLATLPSDAELTECGEALAKQFSSLSRVVMKVIQLPTLPKSSVPSLAFWVIAVDRDQHDKVHVDLEFHRSERTYIALLNVFNAAWNIYKRSCPRTLVGQDV
jgi:hypothetical protein